jgi:hypothetical protein
MWVDRMATTQADMKTQTNTQAVTFSWMVPGEQVVGQLEKVYLYDSFSRKAKVGELTLVKGIIRGYRGVTDPMGEGDLVITNNRIVLLKKGGGRFEIIRDVEYAKKLLEGWGMNYRNTPHGQPMEEQIKRGFHFYNEGEKRLRIGTGDVLTIQACQFLPMMSTAVETSAKGRIGLGLPGFGMLIKIRAPVISPVIEDFAHANVEISVIPKGGNNTAKVMEMLNLVGSRNQPMIDYTSNGEELRKHFILRTEG